MNTGGKSPVGGQKTPLAVIDVVKRTLAMTLMVLLVVNVWFVVRAPSTVSARVVRTGLRGTSTRDLPRRDATHLIVVAGHSVARYLHPAVDYEQDASWYLLPYQVNTGLPGAILRHIQTGVHLAGEDAEAVLVFSGGQTRQEVGPRSEASSYYYIAQVFNWWRNPREDGSPTAAAQPVAAIEEFATDSVENVLFSLCRFKELTGRYPTKVTVVSHEYKRERFRYIVQRALRFNSFEFVGVNPDGEAFDLAKSIDYERNILMTSLSEHPYGCGDPAIDAKREARNPFRRQHAYASTCRALAPLLQECQRSLYTGYLPWDR